jgi:hypothetical protein
MKKNAKKLKLAKETLVMLEDVEAQKAAGLGSTTCYTVQIVDNEVTCAWP